MDPILSSKPSVIPSKPYRRFACYYIPARSHLRGQHRLFGVWAWLSICSIKFTHTVLVRLPKTKAATSMALCDNAASKYITSF